MSHVNRVMCADEPDTLVTAVVATLDLQDGTLRYAVAGHPEPLLITADRDTRFLPGGGLLLGADPYIEYETHTARVVEGSALLLYTDGLVEIDRDYLRGSRELRAAASEAVGNPSENMAEAIQRRLFHGRSANDDAAVLFVGVTRLGAPAADVARTWTLDARDARSAHRAKRAILWYLGNAIRDKSRLTSAELVLGELIGNVARHSPGPAQVTVERRGGAILLRVSDRGRPFRPNGAAADPFAESGRGLFLVRTIADDVRIENTGGGNTVTAVLHGLTG